MGIEASCFTLRKLDFMREPFSKTEKVNQQHQLRMGSGDNESTFDNKATSARCNVKDLEDYGILFSTPIFNHDIQENFLTPISFHSFDERNREM